MASPTRCMRSSATLSSPTPDEFMASIVERGLEWMDGGQGQTSLPTQDSGSQFMRGLPSVGGLQDIGVWHVGELQPKIVTHDAGVRKNIEFAVAPEGGDSLPKAKVRRPYTRKTKALPLSDLNGDALLLTADTELGSKHMSTGKENDFAADGFHGGRSGSQTQKAKRKYVRKATAQKGDSSAEVPTLTTNDQHTLAAKSKRKYVRKALTVLGATRASASEPMRASKKRQAKGAKRAYKKDIMVREMSPVPVAPDPSTFSPPITRRARHRALQQGVVKCRLVEDASLTTNTVATGALLVESPSQTGNITVVLSPTDGEDAVTTVVCNVERQDDYMGSIVDLVKVRLADLPWGGEVLQILGGWVVGTVMGVYGGECNSDAKFEVDFGGDLGIQVVAASTCEVVTTERPHGIAAVTTSEVVKPGFFFDNFAVAYGSSSGDDWLPHRCTDESTNDGLSGGDSDGEDVVPDIMGELGLYSNSGERQNTETFEEMYSDCNWHSRTWSLMEDRPAFRGARPGPKACVGASPVEPWEYFELFWDEGIMDKVVQETNRYSQSTDARTGKLKCGRRWKDLTHSEFRIWLGICIMIGIKHPSCIRDCWRRCDQEAVCPIVSTSMTRDRFEQILRCLHLVNSCSVQQDKSATDYDPLVKTRWLIKDICSNFQKYVNPDEHLCVDESMVAYSGRYCPFKQYIPSKPTKYGIKVWMLACSSSKLCYDLEVYVGKDQQNAGVIDAVAWKNQGSGFGVVSRLTRSLRDRWHTVAMDNFFTSPRLFHSMLEQGFFCVGTARSSRVGYPSSLQIGKKEPRGTMHVRVYRDRKMAALHWTDCKPMHFLSTAVDPVSADCMVTRHVGRDTLQVPSSPIQKLYTRYMRGVDVQDQLRGTYSCAIATKKWWQRLFFFALDTCLTNSYILYREACKGRGITPRSHKVVQRIIAFSLMGRPCKLGVDHLQAERLRRRAASTARRQAVAHSGPTPAFTHSEGVSDVQEGGEVREPLLVDGPQNPRPDGEIIEAPCSKDPNSNLSDFAECASRRRSGRRRVPYSRHAPHPPHPPCHMPAVELHVPTRSPLRRQCVQCGRRAQTRCFGCDGVFMCFPDCFHVMHPRQMFQE